ncbi:MAG: NAD(P)H-dependent oxidoreductase [Rhodobacteraceae bacterium]|nr:NAD(P)H-dependent oxidoreductase [Paracoccaceae bacterium]
MAQPTLLGISGSLRADASNRKLLREAARLFGPCTYIEADLNLPLYDGDDEAANGIPESVAALSQVILEADAILVSTPEYNKGPSGALKNALDWVSRTPDRPWTNKPVAVMSAAAGRAGGERAQLILRTFLLPFRPRILAGPEIHLASSTEQFDEAGQLTNEWTVKDLTTLMEGLKAEMER